MQMKLANKLYYFQIPGGM